MTDLKWSRFNFPVETEKHRIYKSCATQGVF